MYCIVLYCIVLYYILSSMIHYIYICIEVHYVCISRLYDGVILESIELLARDPAILLGFRSHIMVLETKVDQMDFYTTIYKLTVQLLHLFLWRARKG